MNNKQCENLYYRKSFLQKSLPELKLALSVNYSISSPLFQTASRKVFLIVSNRCQESFSTKIFASHYQTAGETFCSYTRVRASVPYCPAVVVTVRNSCGKVMFYTCL